MTSSKYGESYWYNNDRWLYTGSTKDKSAILPAKPSSNSNVSSKCTRISTDCNSITPSSTNWSPGIDYKGDIVNLNDINYVAFTQGNPKTGTCDDDI